MTFGEVRDRVLQLLDQYTVAGTGVAPSYNNQQDYLNAIPNLVNDAVMEIATTAAKIPALLTLSPEEGEVFGNKLRYELPEDFYQFKTGDTFVVTDDERSPRTLHTNRYQLEGRNYLLIPLSEKGAYTITYYRYPRLLGARPQDADELDNLPETHYAVPFYVAAHLVLHDDPFLYASFYNKYEDKLAKLHPGVSAEVHPVGDGYRFHHGDDYYYW